MTNKPNVLLTLEEMERAIKQMEHWLTELGINALDAENITKRVMAQTDREVSEVLEELLNEMEPKTKVDRDKNDGYDEAYKFFAE
jgi:predicted RNA-binding protein Jag